MRGARRERRRERDRPVGPELRFEELYVARGGRRVLHDVSLAIPPGEITTLLGPNGAGKSSLVLAVGGVLRVSSGRVLLGDDDLTRRRPEQVRGAGVAIVPEGRRLLPGLTVEDNLRVATYALSKAGREERDRARARALPRAREALADHLPPALGRRAADGRARPGARLPPARDPRRRALARARAGRRQAPRARARRPIAATGVGILLIEQFAHVALGAREQGVRARGRPHPLRGHGQGADRAARAAALRLPAARQGRRAARSTPPRRLPRPHPTACVRTGTSTARPVTSPSRSFASTSLTDSSGCVSVLSTSRPAACSCMTSQRSSQVPTRLPIDRLLVADQHGRGHGDHAAEADDRVGAAAGEHRHRVGVRLVGADEVEHEVGAAAARQLAHRVDRAAAVEHVVGAELGRPAPGAARRCRSRSWRPIRARAGAAARCGRRRRRRSRRRSCPARGEMPEPPDGVVRGEPGVGVRRDRGRLDAGRQGQRASARARARSRRSRRRPSGR